MNRIRGVWTILLLVGCILGLATTILGVHRYRAYQQGIIEPLRADLMQRTDAAAARIETALDPARLAADDLAASLTRGEFDDAESLERRLSEMIESHDSFFGGAAAFEPYAFDPAQRLYAPYFAKKNGGLEFLRIEESLDYTDPTLEWYATAIARGSRWSEPYFDTSVGDILMTTYSSVARGADAAPRGVVTVDISMDVIREIVRSLDLGGMGYAILLSREGRFLYHPNPELVLSGAGVVEVAGRSGDADLTSLAATILQGGSGIADHTAPLTGLDSWFVYAPVSTSGWSMVSVFVKDDIPIENTVLRHWQMTIGAALVVFVLCALALLLQVTRGERRRIWAFSILASLTLLAGIGFTWQVSLEYDLDAGAPEWVANDQASLDGFIVAAERRSRERLTEPPVFLPTGLFIDSLRFVSRADVEVRGYVWQKYDSELHAGFDRGFQVLGGAALTVGEPLVEQIEGGDVVRWPFQAAFRVRFDYSKFPLMRERISLGLAPRELARNLVLVPDLDAYEILSPAARPGLDESVFLPGWEVTRTYFELRERTVGTNFGLGESTTQAHFPSLYFDIEVRKDFVDTFVSHLVPLIIVGIVVFLVLMIMDRDEDRILLMRTGTGFNLSICATLLFVAVFSHIGARQKIAAQEIVYLEYFYIVMYVAILWVAVNSIVMILRPDFWFTRYEENLLSRTAFWPITLGALWVATLVTFF